MGRTSQTIDKLEFEFVDGLFSFEIRKTLNLR